MVATLQSDRRFYKQQVKADPDLVYYEYRIDTCGTGDVEGLKSQSSIGVMSHKSALKLKTLIEEIQREQR